MVRLLACALALTACDAIYGLDTVDIPNAPCGPYGAGTPLTFDPSLQSPHDFSIGSDAFHGSVVVTSSGPSTQPVVLGSDNTWRADATLSGALPPSPSEGRIVGDGELYETDADMADTLQEFTLGSNLQWKEFQSPVLTLPGFDLEVGNAITQVSQGVPQNHIAVVLERPKSVSDKPALVIAQIGQPFNDNTWQVNLQATTELLHDGNLLDIGQGVVTLDRSGLVYAAKYSDDTSFRLYVATLDRSNGTYSTGTQLIGLTNNGSDELAPSIDATCHTIYYQSGSQTMMATVSPVSDE